MTQMEIKRVKTIEDEVEIIKGKIDLLQDRIEQIVISLDTEDAALEEFKQLDLDFDFDFDEDEDCLDGVDGDSKGWVHELQELELRDR